MDEETRQAIRDLIFEVDNLASYQRNISMQSFKDYPEIRKLRENLETK